MGYNEHVRIDLHIHSIASDGTLSPDEILSLAQEQRLGAISITDHDTLEGSTAAQQIDCPLGVKLLSGVEISAAPPSFAPFSGSLHILGYGFDLNDSELNRMLMVLQEARKNRNPEILRRLSHLGFDITLNDIVREVGGGQIGRPHIARVMVARGFVHSIDEAFDKYIGQGKPAYVDKFRIPCRQALDIVLGAGGISVLAHPFLLNISNRDDLEHFIISLKEMGLEGIEAYYPEHPPEETLYYEHLANKLGLLMTGGTDFHGSLKPEIQMGTGNGDFHVPYRLYEQLMARLA